ncbi:MAG TPA: glycosyltransferase [Gemmatales bacterium]|nr:glycosyltransferase [Gemmatales bacterium]
MLRVLHVVSGLSWRFGGTSAAVLTMTEALAQTGQVHVEIATTTADGAGGCLAPTERPRPAVPCHWFRRDALERWKVSVGLASWLHAHAGDYDLLHVHALWTFSTAAACAAARRRRVPYLLMAHGMLSDRSFARGRWRKQLYWQAVERRNVREAARIHVTSQSEADDLAQLDVPTRPAVVPLGLTAEAWTSPATPERLRQKCEPPARGRPIILCLARLHPIKGITDVLLPALALLDGQAFLALVGGPDEHEPDYAREVERTIAQLGLTENVAVLGMVAGEERFGLFDGAEVVVLPSHYESFGLVAVEAMARAKPVVVTTGVKASEHVTKADAGRVVPVEAQSLAIALRQLLAAPEERARLGRLGQAYVQQELAWPRIASGLVELYHDVAQPRRQLQDVS